MVQNGVVMGGVEWTSNYEMGEKVNVMEMENIHVVRSTGGVEKQFHIVNVMDVSIIRIGKVGNLSPSGKFVAFWLAQR